MSIDEATQILRGKLRDLTTNPIACITESEYIQALSTVIHAVEETSNNND